MSIVECLDFGQTQPMPTQINQISQAIIGAAMEVHRTLGPGLLESAYEPCLAHEFSLRQMPFEQQKPLPVVYKAVQLDCGYRLDFLVAEMVVVEVKAIECLLPIHQAQVLRRAKRNKRHVVGIRPAVWQVSRPEDGVV